MSHGERLLNAWILLQVTLRLFDLTCVCAHNYYHSAFFLTQVSKIVEFVSNDSLFK